MKKAWIAVAAVAAWMAATAWGQLPVPQDRSGATGRADLAESQVPKALQDELRERVARSLDGAPQLDSLRTVVLVPLAEDAKGNVGSLVRDAVSRTRIRPVDLPAATLDAARKALRGATPPADALLCGTVRDFSQVNPAATGATSETVWLADVQLRIETADGRVPWSETFRVTAREGEARSDIDAEHRERIRRAVREAFDAAADAFKTSPIPDGVPVAALPIPGDADGEWAGLLKNALNAAGKNPVEAKDDPMWDEIVKEVDWTRIVGKDILDPETIAQFGRLQQAKILIKARVHIPEGLDRVRAEVWLHATDLATKQHIWGGVFSRRKPNGDGNPPGPIVEPLALNVEVRVNAEKNAEQEGDEVGSWTRGRLAALGYRVDARQESDLALTLDVASQILSKDREWTTYRGSLHATLELLGRDGRVLGDKIIYANGVPGLDDRGHVSLAYNLERELGAWMERTLGPGHAEYVAERLTLQLADPVELARDHSAIAEIRAALEGLPGVRSASVFSQNDSAGIVTYRVEYKPVDVPDGLINALNKARPKLMDKYLWR